MEKLASIEVEHTKTIDKFRKRISELKTMLTSAGGAGAPGSGATGDVSEYAERIALLEEVLKKKKIIKIFGQKKNWGS
jgi:hypothetical protein